MATGIFIVVIGSMVTLSRLALRNSVLANHRTQAYNLAEDAIESVRQIRDTNWIVAPKGSSTQPLDPALRWQAFVHDCTSGDIDAFKLAAKEETYDLCFDGNIAPSGRFGLQAANISTTKAIKLGPNGGAADPGSPTYRRLITVEPLTDGELKLLGGNASNDPVVLSGIEGVHFVRVKVTVSWRDFDQDWKVDLSTVLSNWKAQ